MHLKLFSIVFLFISLAGCVKDEIEDPAVDRGKEYFPLIVGQFIDYQVDSIVFDDAPGGNKMDTVRFQLREEIASFQVSSGGDTTYYLHRSRRADELQSWKLTDVWTAARSEYEAVRTEENLKFRKMAFPLKDGKNWIATSYINPNTTVLIGTEHLQPYQDWEASVEAIDEQDVIGDFIFAPGQVMHILQTDTDDTTMKRYVFEKYVRHIGLVQKEEIILDSRCIEIGDFAPCIGKPWLENASKGYILIQVMIGHN
ncbi:MAG: hypothetical protein ABIQ11_00610 [Saprospiraceae bacterium]